jgi:Holliday junction resolvase
MPINSRTKGARTERELAQKLREELGWQARRTQQFCGLAGDSDVVVMNVPQLFIESKNVQKLNVSQAMAKAVEDAKAAGKLPCLCHKKDRQEWLLTVRLSDLRLLSEMVVQSQSMRMEQSGQTLDPPDMT